MKCISFDPATKTFGYAVMEVDDNIMCNNYKQLVSHAKLALYSGSDYDTISTFISKLTAAIEDMKAKIRILEGAVIDLAPGTSDDDLSIQNRIKLLKPIVDKIKIKYNTEYTVFIEYQMIHNTKSASIAHALMAYFAEYNIIIVTPALKNNVDFVTGPKYSDYTHYKQTYTSNKKHSEANLAHIVNNFGPHGQIQISSHTADCVMQVLGHMLANLSSDLSYQYRHL